MTNIDTDIETLYVWILKYNVRLCKDNVGKGILHDDGYIARFDHSWDSGSILEKYGIFK
ncbi:MAG: hypothetical protein WC523_04880 [Patescibacteria group bacterium]